MRIRAQQIIFLAFVFSGSMLAGGCSKTGSTLVNSAITYVSVVNMAPYAGTTDVYLNGTLSSPAGGIPAGAFSLKYGGLKPATYDLVFKKTGSDSVLSDLGAQTYDTTGFYTVVLYNTSGGGAAHSVRITEDFSTISNFNTNYRFFNLAPDAPAVDLYLNSTLSQPGRTNADIVSNNSFTIFQQILPNTYNLKAVLANASPDSTAIASVTGVNMQAGGVYTLFLSETKNATGTAYTISVLPATY
jgi:Domain of unknown function (DUF4397)